ncbi:MAG: bifunctional oligoribonuclease/PAP phosphatase NrnA [Treponema sp.]|jgi:phosphoesterase RecJ-like protein|nr:bifunctional oligoribonuclease/PAP phosphatase NrnA [Treponema sp.]
MAIPVPVPQILLDFIREGGKFLIVGHKEPDGDCVGSQLALTSVLQRLGKEAVPCSAGPFKRTEVMPYENRFVSAPGEKEREGARVILLDCSSSSRAGDLADCLKGLPLAIVDHHVAGQDPAEAAHSLVYLDAQAPSVTFMTLGIIEALGLQPTREEAELLLFGLCTDTGFFRHVDSRGAETFEYAARLIRAGASPKEAFHAINGGKTLASRKLLGIQLFRSEAYFGGKFILTSEKYEETQQFGLEGRDSDNLYQLLQSINGVDAVAIIRQETPEKCTLGFRSRDKIDVARIALRFGGGGHKNAAGANIAGTIEELQPRVLAAFEEVFGK